MNLLNFINKKIIFREQVSFLKSLVYTFPISFGIPEITFYLIKDDYEITVIKLIFKFILLAISLSVISLPLIINYYKQTKKYKKILNKIVSNNAITVEFTNWRISGRIINPKKIKVKCIFKYKDYEIGKVYDINYLYDDIMIGHYDLLKNVINKFELDDIKAERLRKLKKLNRIK